MTLTDGDVLLRSPHMSTVSDPWPVAVIASGNIGTDLMIKILRGSGE